MSSLCCRNFGAAGNKIIIIGDHFFLLICCCAVWHLPRMRSNVQACLVLDDVLVLMMRWWFKKTSVAKRWLGNAKCALPALMYKKHFHRIEHQVVFQALGTHWMCIFNYCVGHMLMRPCVGHRTWSETDRCSKPYMVQCKVKTDDAKPETTFTNTWVTHL